MIDDQNLRNPPALDKAQDALSKMRRAELRGTGCRLTREEIESLALTSIGQMWAEEDPRKAQIKRNGGVK